MSKTLREIEDFGSSGFTECTLITIHRTVFQYTYITVPGQKKVDHGVTK